MPLPITPQRLSLADRKRGLRAVEKLMDRLKREGLGIVGIMALLRAAVHHPEAIGSTDLDPELRYNWHYTADRLKAAGMLTLQRAGANRRAKVTATLTPRAQRILGL